MPPVPPLLVKRPSRLQMVVSAVQGAGAVECALPGAPLPAAVAKAPLSLSEVEEEPDKPRTAPMPPSSTQGIGASVRVRKELADAMAREADAPAQYRAAFRAYTVAYQSMDGPVETQAQAIWALVYASLRLGYSEQANVLGDHVHTLLPELRSTGHLAAVDLHQHHRLRLAAATLEQNQDHLALVAEAAAHEVSCGALSQRPPVTDALWQTILAAAEALGKVGQLSDARALLNQFGGCRGDIKTPPADVLLRARYVALLCQLVLGQGDRVEYPRCKDQLENCIHALCEAEDSPNSPDASALPVPVAVYSNVVLGSVVDTARNPACGACSIQLGKPCVLWSQSAPSANCQCAMTQQLLHVTRLYARVLHLLGEHHKANAVDTSLSALELTDMEPGSATDSPIHANDSFASACSPFANQETPNWKQVHRQSLKSLHNLSLSVGPPEGDRPSPALETPQPNVAGAWGVSLTPTLSMLDGILIRERAASMSPMPLQVEPTSAPATAAATPVALAAAAPAPARAPPSTTTLLASAPRAGTRPGRGMPPTPAIASASPGRPKSHPPVAGGRSSYRAPLSSIQETGSRPQTLAKTAMSRALGPLPSVPATPADAPNAPYEQPRWPGAPSTPIYHSLETTRADSGHGASALGLTCEDEQARYNHLQNRAPEYALMAEPAAPGTPLTQVEPAAAKAAQGEPPQPVFLGKIAKRKASRSLIKVWQRAVKPETKQK